MSDGESATDVRLDGDEMTADPDDGDVLTYIRPGSRLRPYRSSPLGSRGVTSDSSHR
jgi:hypothetical protein